jgi:WD40 repeat protein
MLSALLATTEGAGSVVAQPADSHLPEGVLLRLGSADFRQGERVDGLVVLGGGKQIATISGRYLIVWDAANGHVVSSRELSPELERLTDLIELIPKPGQLAATPDGLALVAVRGRRATFYKLPPHKDDPIKLPLVAPARGGRIVAVAPGAKGDEIVGISAKGAMLEWHPGADKWATADSPLRLAAINTPIVASGGGVLAILERRNGRLCLWDAVAGKSLGTQDVDRVTAVAVSGDGKRFITTGATCEVLTVADRKSVASWKPRGVASRVALSSDGALAAVGYSRRAVSDEGKVDLYEVATGKVRRTLPVPGGAWRLAFLPGGDLITVDAVGLIQVWDAATGQPRHKPVGHCGRVRSVVPNPSGGWFSCDSQGLIIAWDSKGNELRRLEGHTRGVTGLALSKDGKLLYSAGLDGTVREWSAETGREQRKCIIKVPITESLDSLALSPNGKLLAAGAGTGEVRLLQTNELTLVEVMKPKEPVPGDTFAVVFASDEILMSRIVTGKIHVWRVGGKGEVREINAGGGSWTLSAQLAVSPDGKSVASPVAREGGKASLGTPGAQTDVGFWDIGTGKLLDRLKTETKANITAVTFLPGGKFLAVGDAAGTVWVIDLEKKATRRVFKGHRGPVLSLAASPDGKALASGGADTTVLVWKLDTP